MGVCDWGWFAPAESHHRWAISVPVTLSPLSDPCSVCGRRLFWFRDSWALLLPGLRSPDLGCPLLPCATRLSPTESSASAYGKLRFCLRKLRLCPTESSASAYGKLRFCLRKLRLCPTESSASAYGSSASALRKAPLLPTEAPPLPYGKLSLVSRCVLLPVINSLSATESSRLHCDSNTVTLVLHVYFFSHRNYKLICLNFGYHVTHVLLYSSNQLSSLLLHENVVRAWSNSRDLDRNNPPYQYSNLSFEKRPPKHFNLDLLWFTKTHWGFVQIFRGPLKPLSVCMHVFCAS